MSQSRSYRQMRCNTCDILPYVFDQTSFLWLTENLSIFGPNVSGTKFSEGKKLRGQSVRVEMSPGPSVGRHSVTSTVLFQVTNVHCANFSKCIFLFYTTLCMHMSLAKACSRREY
jgi:hypothetical protein